MNRQRRYKPHIILLFCFVCFDTYGAASSSDPNPAMQYYKNIIQHSKDQRERSETYLQLGYFYLSLDNGTYAALKKNKKAILNLNAALAIDQLDAQRRANTLMTLGRIYYFGGNGVVRDFGKAILNLNAALAINGLDEQRRAKALMILGQIYFFGDNGVMKNYEKAVLNLNAALATGQLGQDEAITLMLLGRIYSSGGNGIAKNYRKAMLNLNEALADGQLSQADKAHTLMALGRINFLGSDDVMRNYEKATSNLSAALAIKQLDLYDEVLAKITLEWIETAEKSKKPIDDRHAQFIIFIDEHGQENPSIISRASVTTSFMVAISSSNNFSPVPFIVSCSIVDNFLTRNLRKDPVNDISFMTDIDIDANWDLYVIPETQFILFVPKSYKEKNANHGLIFEQKNKITTTSVQSLIDASFAPFDPRQLEKVFKIKNKLTYGISDSDALPVWDIIIEGHGHAVNMQLPHPGEIAYIAGVSAKTMQDLLRFFNDKLDVSALLIRTCSAGGKNSTLLQFDQAVGNETLLDLNYMIVVASISDEVTSSSELTPLLYEEFFQLLRSDRPVGDLIKMLGSMQVATERDPFASNNTPQVWVPGGYGFQTYQVDERIKVLSNVIVAAHEDEKEAIVIPHESEIVLVHPKHIHVPIVINSCMKLKDTSGRPNNAKSEFPVTFQGGLKAQPNACLFPKFIYMNRGNRLLQYNFSNITLKSDDNPLFGIMHFLAYSLYSSVSPDIVKIGTLVGENDLSPMLTFIRKKNAETRMSELEKELRSFKRITLEDVLMKKEGSDLKLIFTFRGKSWIGYYNAEKKMWSFYPRMFSAVSSAPVRSRRQLSISEAIKKKLAKADGAPTLMEHQVSSSSSSSVPPPISSALPEN